MSDLFAYLDCSGPEYAWLGHFRQREFLEAGHNVDPELDPLTAPKYSGDSDVFKQPQMENFNREIREDRIANIPEGEAEQETKGTRDWVVDSHDNSMSINARDRTRDSNSMEKWPQERDQQEPGKGSRYNPRTLGRAIVEMSGSEL